MMNFFSGRAKLRLVIGAGFLMLLACGLLIANAFSNGAGNASKPQLMIMSSIPLQWGEVGIGEIAKGETEPSALFEHLAESNRLYIIDDFQKLDPSGKTPLLLIQPRALAPRELVQLDAWIRQGGKAIIFADPALDWPSNLPLGDPKRPLFTSLLMPMFRHWGLELALPVSNSVDAPTAMIGEYQVDPKSPGLWVSAENSKASAKCSIRKDEFIASCTIGRGHVLLIADADLLHEDRWTDGVMRDGTTAWLDAVIAALRESDMLTGKLWDS
jgi:hypothetical protein